MFWYHYVAVFFAGAFFANTVPHFVHGISGNKFPTPFAKPPGRGLSSPPVNVLWSFVNLVAGLGLWYLGMINLTLMSVAVAIGGALCISLLLSVRFQQKARE